MKIVSFYSFKGGVGRSLALINVGHWLARAGCSVLWIDLDLEAPGLGRTEATGGPGANEGPGVSDLVLGWLEGPEVALADCVRPVRVSAPGKLSLMPAGTRAEELAHEIRRLYRDPNAPEALVFARLREALETTDQYDVVLVDSRTGLADVAGVCTVELPDAVIAICGLNEQNVAGMSDVLGRITRHPFRGDVPPALIAVLSPLPSREWVGSPPGLTYKDLVTTAPEAVRSPNTSRWAHLPDTDARSRDRWIRLENAIRYAQSRLLPSVFTTFETLRTRFPDLRQSDLVHGLEHDAEIPLLGELLLDHRSALSSQYAGLASSVGAAFLGLSRTQAHVDDFPLLVASTPSEPRG